MPYLTPQSIPEETVCFLIRVPNDTFLKSAFFGALLDLTLAYNWEQSDGGLTPQQTINFTTVWYQEIMEAMCMGICDDIIAGCLTNPDFIEEIIDSLLPTGVGGIGSGSETPLTAIDNYDISGLSVGCNDGDKYGVAFSIVNQLNIVARDLLQIVELASNAVEAASELIEAIPLFGGLLSSIVETVNWIQEYVDEAYNSFFTLETHEELACAIFCEMDECELTINDIRTAFRTILLDQLPPSPGIPFPDFIAWMTPLVVSLTPIQVIAIVQLFVVEVLVRGSRFLGTDYRILEIAGAFSSPLAPPEGCGCVPVQCWKFVQSGMIVYGIDNGDGTFSSVNTGLSVAHRVQIEFENFSTNQWTLGSVVSGAVNNTENSVHEVRIWDSGDFGGSLVQNSNYATAITESPISGGAIAIISSSAFTINLSLSEDNECD